MKKKANLLEKQEHRPYMTNGWHVSVVKTDVQKYSDPQDHKNCTTWHKKTNNCDSNEATSAYSHISSEPYDPPPAHLGLGTRL